MSAEAAGDLPPSDGPIFVVGAMRSGSTLLRLMLDSHENIAIGPETGFMGAVTAARAIPNFKYGDVWFERIGWTRQELDARLRESFGEMFQRFAAQQHKTRWGEKTPFHTWHMQAMAEVFPDAVFVAIVRHPGAVAASLRDRFHYTFEDAVTYWAETNRELLRRASALGPRLALCRYEDLVLDPEAVLRPLLGWLGEPWSPSVLAHHEVQKERGTPRMSDGATITHDSVDPSRASAWTDLVTDADRRTLSAHAGELAAFFGYQVLEPVPSVASDRLLEDGRQIAARIERDRVDLRQHAPALQPDRDPVDLARRLARAEASLARVRRRRSVRLGDALRRAQRNRSLADVRAVLQVLLERSRRP